MKTECVKMAIIHINTLQCNLHMIGSSIQALSCFVRKQYILMWPETQFAWYYNTIELAHNPTAMYLFKVINHWWTHLELCQRNDVAVLRSVPDSCLLLCAVVIKAIRVCVKQLPPLTVVWFLATERNPRQ